jgi:hypothetical protein
MPIRLARALIVLAAIGVALPAFATGEIESLITDADRERLAQYDATLADAVETARAGGSAADVETMDAAISAEALPFADFDLTGEWQCRTMKLGGAATLVVYGWFRCRVTDDGSGWKLEKLSGSQRTVGRFFTESDNRLTYLGSFHVAGETARPYGAGPESDQAGYAIRTGERSWWIGLPRPYYESEFDILELR